MTDPIQQKYREFMNELADELHKRFNPDPAKPTTGFMLTIFDFDNPHDGRFNYISNANKLDVRAMLKEITARIEGRIQQEKDTKQ